MNLCRDLNIIPQKILIKKSIKHWVIRSGTYKFHHDFGYNMLTYIANEYGIRYDNDNYTSKISLSYFAVTREQLWQYIDSNILEII